MNAQAIKTEVVEVRYADPPREGKKRATIKTPAGDLYFMPPAMLDMFKRGRRYRIEYTEAPWQGRQIRTIVKADPEEAPTRSANHGSTAGAGDANGGEAEFVSRCLAASIMAGHVSRAKDEIAERARMLKALYRDLFA